MKCGCKIKDTYNAEFAKRYKIVHCSLHAAAGELRDSLQYYFEKYGDKGNGGYIKDLLSRAEGKDK